MRDFRQEDWEGAGTRQVEKKCHGCNAGEDRARADAGLFLENKPKVYRSATVEYCRCPGLEKRVQQLE